MAEQRNRTGYVGKGCGSVDDSLRFRDQKPGGSIDAGDIA